RRLKRFVDGRLAAYATERNHPDADATSGLSPYLHWGHVSIHQVLAAIAKRDGWSPEQLPSKGGGAREGWWRTSPEAEAFLDEAVTWRELGFNMAHKLTGHDRYETLPAWARATLERHATDARPVLYSAARLEA